MKIYAVVSEPGCRSITFEVLVQDLLGKKNCMILPSYYFLEGTVNPKDLDKQVLFVNCANYEDMMALRQIMDFNSILFSQLPIAVKEYDISFWNLYTPRDITLSVMRFLEHENLKQYKDPCMVDLFGEIKNPVE